MITLHEKYPMNTDPAAIEREQCALLCERIVARYELDVWTVAARACVIAIRARAVTRYFEPLETKGNQEAKL